MIAGEYAGNRGPAETFTPIEVWDLRVAAGKTITLKTPEGHTTAIVPMKGNAVVNGTHAAGPAQLARAEPQGWRVHGHGRG